jgi:SAM-dependent methyltransferase
VTVANVSGPGDGEYWDDVVSRWQPTVAHRLWRAHSDAVNVELLRRWLPTGSGRLLKTDLFDEAVASGLYPELALRADEVVGIDVSSLTVQSAARQHPGLVALVGSVLAIPCPDASFDTVVSNSTLDHFERRTMLRAAVVELARVMRPGGQLIITLDNRVNPYIGARTSPLLASLHRRLGIVPYFVGVTCGARGLWELLRDSGFEVRDVTAIMHCPPQLAAVLADRTWAERFDPDTEQRHVRQVLRWETMEHWPTRHLTGHFVAARAVRLTQPPQTPP